MQIPPTPNGLLVLPNTITPEPPLAPNEKFSVVFTHSIKWFQYDTDGTTAIPCATNPPGSLCFRDTTDYELVINGTVYAKLAYTINVWGYCTMTVAGGLPVGNHSIVVRAIGGGGASQDTVVLTLPVVQR